MPIYRKGEGQWTPEKQAGLVASAEGEAEGYYRREGMSSSSIPPQQLQKDMAHERGWAIGANPHIKASNVIGPVSGAGLAKGKHTYATSSPNMKEFQAKNMASNSDMKI